MVERANERRERRRRWLFVLASVAAHVAIAGLLGSGPRTRIDDPERTSTIPLSLFTPGGGSVAAAEPAPPQVEPESGAASSAAPPRRAAERRIPAARTATDQGEAAPTDPNGVDEGEHVGTGDDTSSDEFLDALMASSGPRRPQPGACPDPIVGTWRARRYDTPQDKRAEFMLRIQKHEGGRIEGRITLRAWTGNSPIAPRCSPGVFFHTVRMPARGTYRGDAVSFEATSFSRVSHCEDPGFQYNLDHFTGRTNGDSLRAVNNDGGHEVDTPYVFERIACH